MDDASFERFREYSTEQMARFFGAMEEMRQEALDNERRNREEHRRFRAELRAAVREGVRFVRETRREIQASNTSTAELRTSIAELRDVQRVTEQKLQAFIDSLRQGGNGRP